MGQIVSGSVNLSQALKWMTIGYTIKSILCDLRPEYDLSQLKGGVRGKYYRRASAGTNLVLIEPDLAVLFPNAEALNRALRVLAEAARSTTARKRRSAR